MRHGLNLPLAAYKAIRTYREHGFRQVLRAVTSAFAPHLPDAFDVRRGTETSRVEPLWRLNIHSDNVREGARYQAVGEAELAGAIAWLGEDPHAFTFVDLGCGKGRALIIAAELGFERVFGIEFAAQLISVAQQNLEKLALMNIVRVVHGNAADFRFPPDDLVVFLYNPFGASVMEKVVANLPRSAAKLRIIYKHPLCAASFDAADFLMARPSPPGHPDIQIWSNER
jgi:SAM-dependent methyltransferase